MNSTVRKPPHTLMFDSPRPVDPAAPMSLSVYWPAPMIGLSPTRPDLERQARGGRHRGDIALGCDGITVDGSRGPYGHVLSLGHVQVVIVRIQIGPPVQPDLARVRGEQIFFLEAVLQREPLRSLPHQTDVIRVLEHELRDLGGSLDPFERADG